jgi:hypothetical protein
VAAVIEVVAGNESSLSLNAAALAQKSAAR